MTGERFPRRDAFSDGATTVAATRAPREMQVVSRPISRLSRQTIASRHFITR